MNPSEIAPTKTNLFEYKAQLLFSIDGHSLLEEKREVLVMHLMEIISKVKEQRVRLNRLLMESFQLLKITEVEVGEYELQKIIQGSVETVQVEIHEKGIMGVNLPTIRYKKTDAPEMKPKSRSGTPTKLTIS